jgi:hypothetical protein
VIESEQVDRTNSRDWAGGLRSREHSFVPIAVDGCDGVGSIENPTFAVQVRAPDMPPNHQQQPVNMKLARASTT